MWKVISSPIGIKRHPDAPQTLIILGGRADGREWLVTLLPRVEVLLWAMAPSPRISKRERKGEEHMLVISKEVS